MEDTTRQKDSHSPITEHYIIGICHDASSGKENAPWISLPVPPIGTHKS